MSTILKRTGFQAFATIGGMDYMTYEFPTKDALRAWYVKNARTTPGMWIKIYKKHSGIPSVAIEEALDEALCFGWIDGQRKGFDEYAYLQKYTPRRPKSLWSKRNVEHIERLTAAGLMTEDGFEQDKYIRHFMADTNC
mgnify:CR=1 FL=1